jgi:predicted ribonuclease YlaK
MENLKQFKEIFVIDTSVIMHLTTGNYYANYTQTGQSSYKNIIDYLTRTAEKSSVETAIIFPITLLAELDKIIQVKKEPSAQIANNVVRWLLTIIDDATNRDNLLSSGIRVEHKIGRKKYKFTIICYKENERPSNTLNWLDDSINDDYFISKAYNLTSKYPRKKVVLLTHDILLRVRAREANINCIYIK